MFCQDWSAVKWANPYLIVKPLYCRSWQCGECAPKRKTQLIAQAHGGDPELFLTLTCRASEGDGPNHRAQLLSKQWKAVRRAAMTEAKRNLKVRAHPAGAKLDPARTEQIKGRTARCVKLTGKTLPFIAVFERHQSGEPHLHILVRAKWINQEWLSKQMMTRLNSPIVDVRAVTDKKRVAFYVSKYLGKDPHKFEGVKRYWTSPDWRLKKMKPASERIGGLVPWKIEQVPYHKYIHDCEGLGYLDVSWREGIAYLTKGPPS